MEQNNKNYILMPGTETYALGVEAIREAYENNECQLQPLYAKPYGSQIVRPLTFRENLQARIEDYNTLNNPDGSERTNDERLRLFNILLDSCTGVAYKAGTTKFKIVPQSLDLIEILPRSNKRFMNVDYEGILEEEFDSRKYIYDSSLTKERVLCYPAWLAAAEDKALLSEYTSIIFGLLKEKYGQTNGMGFFVRSNTETDELRALFVNNLDIDSNACGDYNLNNGGSFLCVAPPQKILQGEQ